MFPVHRPRRLRKNQAIRRMVRETSLSPDDFIYPLFVTFGKGVKKEISSMPGCYQESVDEIVRHAKEVHSLGIPSILLFGIPEHKDEIGSSAYDAHGVVQEAIRAIKEGVKLNEIMARALDAYINSSPQPIINNSYQVTVDSTVASSDSSWKFISSVATLPQGEVSHANH